MIYEINCRYTIILSIVSLIMGTFEHRIEQLPPSVALQLSWLDHRTGQHNEVTGSNPIEFLNFSGLSAQLLRKLCSYGGGSSLHIQGTLKTLPVLHTMFTTTALVTNLSNCCNLARVDRLQFVKFIVPSFKTTPQSCQSFTKS